MPVRNWGLPGALTVGKTWKGDRLFSDPDREDWYVTRVEEAASGDPGKVDIVSYRPEILQGPMPPDWWAMWELQACANQIMDEDLDGDDYDRHREWFGRARAALERLQEDGVGCPDWGNMRGWRQERALEKMSG